MEERPSSRLLSTMQRMRHIGERISRRWQSFGSPITTSASVSPKNTLHLDATVDLSAVMKKLVDLQISMRRMIVAHSLSESNMLVVDLTSIYDTRYISVRKVIEECESMLFAGVLLNDGGMLLPAMTLCALPNATCDVIEASLFLASIGIVWSSSVDSGNNLRAQLEYLSIDDTTIDHVQRLLTVLHMDLNDQFLMTGVVYLTLTINILRQMRLNSFCRSSWPNETAGTMNSRQLMSLIINSDLIDDGIESLVDVSLFLAHRIDGDEVNLSTLLEIYNAMMRLTREQRITGSAGNLVGMILQQLFENSNGDVTEMQALMMQLEYPVAVIHMVQSTALFGDAVSFLRSIRELIRDRDASSQCVFHVQAEAVSHADYKPASNCTVQ